LIATETTPSSLTFEQVRGLLAHRFPFLMVDRVMAIEPGKRLVAVKHVSGNEICFLGHFPQEAIFPGVLILEAMAQSLSLLDGLSRAEGEAAKYLGSADVHFRAPVLPGHSLEIEAVMIKQMARGIVGKVFARVEGLVVAQGEVVLGTGNSVKS
jgi:3-hydroxyacyl-[acyl-carrier-protein] dehydratase